MPDRAILRLSAADASGGKRGVRTVAARPARAIPRGTRRGRQEPKKWTAAAQGQPAREEEARPPLPAAAVAAAAFSPRSA